MNKAVPWSIKGVDFDAREAAKEAARRSGMTLGEWLASVISDKASEMGVDSEDVDDDTRLEAITARLAKISRKTQADVPKSRTSAPRRRQPFREIEDDEDDQDFDPEPHRSASRRRSDAREASYLDARRPERPRAHHVEHYDDRRVYADPEALLDDAVRTFERGTRRTQAETAKALDRVSRRLSSIEAALGDRDDEPADNGVHRALARLESRMETIGGRQPKQADPAEAALRKLDEKIEKLASQIQPPEPEPSADMARIEGKLNKLLRSVDRPQRIEPAPRPAPAPEPYFEPEPEPAPQPAREAVYQRAPAGPPRTMSDAIAQIAERQRELDQSGRQKAAPPAPQRPRAPQPAAWQPPAPPPIYAPAMPQAYAPPQQAYAPPPAFAPPAAFASPSFTPPPYVAAPMVPPPAVAHPSAAPAVLSVEPVAAPPADTGLKSEIANLAARIDEMRRESALREAQMRREAALREEQLRKEAEEARKEADARADRVRREADAARKDAEARAEKLRREAEQREAKFREAEDLRRMEAETRHQLFLREAASAAGGDGATAAAILDRSLITPEIEALRHQLADMGKAVAGLASRDAVKSLETAIRDLTKRVDVSRREGVGEAVLGPVDELLADIRKSLSDFAPRSTVDTIATELRGLDAKVSALGSSDIDRSTLERVQEQTLEIRNLLAAAVAHPLPLESIERQISALTDRVDFLAATGSTGNASAVGETVDEIRNSLDRSAPPSLLRKLEERIEQLAHKLDDAVSQAGASDQLDELTRRIDDVHRALTSRPDAPSAPSADVHALESMIRDLAVKIDGAVSQSSASDQLDELTDRINDVHRELTNRVERGTVVAGDTGALESMIRDLSEKVDAASQPSEDGGMVETLQTQIARLSERLDRNDANIGSISSLERIVGDLFHQLDDARTVAIQAAESAAHQAAQEVLRAAQSHAPVAQAPDAITHDLAQIRQLQDAADRRAHATLTAVHETLEKVVDRLALLENEVGEVRSGARAPTPHFEPAPASVRHVAQAQAVERSAPHEQDAPEWLKEPEPAEPVRMPRVEPDFSTMDFAAPRPGDVSAPLGGSDDILIEPGSGFAPRAGAKAETSSFSTDDGKPSQSSFIAAARRAAQAATIEAAQQAERKPTSPVEGAIADAKARARAAAAAISRAKEDGDAKPSLAAKGKALFGNKRRAIILGVAAIVVVLGSIQIARTMMAQRAVAPIIDLSATQKAPARAAPVEGDEATPAAGPQRQGALTKSPTSQSASAKPPGVDNDPVASIGSQARALDPSGLQNSAAIDPGVQAGPLRDLAAKGNASAQYELAVRLAEGRNVTRDLRSAAQWLERAALQDLAPAQYRLGSLYEKGLGVDRDAAKARTWYTKAADKGNVKAMQNLAVLLADGGGDKPDYAGAAQWFHKASERGVRDSQYNLAILYARGLGTPQNMQQAYSWFSIAAKQGDQEAAKKRDEVGARLNTEQLAAAKAAAENFRPKNLDQASNEVEPPPGGWAQPANAAAKPADIKPAEKPGQSQPAPKTNVKAKVSAI